MGLIRCKNPRLASFKCDERYPKFGLDGNDVGDVGNREICSFGAFCSLYDLRVEAESPFLLIDGSPE